MNSTPIEGDEGAGAGNGENRKSQPTAPAPGEPRRIGLFTFVVRSMSPEALAAEDARAERAGMTLATWIQRRFEELRGRRL